MATPKRRRRTGTRWAMVLGAALAMSAGCETPQKPDPQASPQEAVGADPSTPAPGTSPVWIPPTAALNESGGPPSAVGDKIVLQEAAMGTSIVLSSFTTVDIGDAQLRQKLLKAFEEIQRLEALMTTWQPDSEISRVNQQAGKGPSKVGPESLAVIQKSQWISGKSQGVFDISFDAMHGLWRFDDGDQTKPPDANEIAARKQLIDYESIVVDETASTVFLKKEGMRINLGGIAKGYAVDRAAAVLEQEGLSSFYIQAGGDLYVRGKKPDGSRYRVGIRDPRSNDPYDYFAMLEVEDHAFSTAGDYERYFIQDGKRYHHIIDPRTGYPATASRSVTIWAKDALIADAVDDAVFILGPQEGLALVESLPDCGAVIVDKDNKVWVSERLKGLVYKVHEPTDGI